MEKLARITHKEDGWHLYSKDGKRHLGGPYKKRDEAVKREHQVQYFKKNAAFENYFAIKLAKYQALGIPDKKRFMEMPVSENTVWLANIQEHYARIRGKHFDLRLNDPNSLHAYSWAISKLPEPGEKVPAIEQPTHSKKYMGWSGVIEAGKYGAGPVKSLLFDNVEVLRSTPNEILFNVYGPGQKVSRYFLKRGDGDKLWMLFNYTATTKTRDIPAYKPRMKEIKIEDVKIDEPKQVLAPKFDGAHTTVLMRPGKRLDVYSYRLSKKSPQRIDHTYRTNLYKVRSPKELGTTIVRAELYLPSENSSIVSSLLNTSVWKSREKQKNIGRLQNVMFDVVKYKGRKVEDLPYSEKLNILRNINKYIPELKLPVFATTPIQKMQLLKKIRTGIHSETREGVVVYDLDKPIATKAKMSHDYDAKIIGVYGAKLGSKYYENAIGGFTVAPEYDPSIRLQVGTGISDKVRRDAYKNHKKYVGQWIKIKGQEKYDSGKLRAPVVVDLRSEKYPSLTKLGFYV